MIRDINRKPVRKRFYADTRYEKDSGRRYCLVRGVDHSVERPSLSLAYMNDLLNERISHYEGDIAYQAAQNLRPVSKDERKRVNDSLAKIVLLLDLRVEK